jgi:hypothetical protein
MPAPTASPAPSSSRPAVWGHFTMFNLREQDTAAIDQIYAEALAG